MMAASNCGSFLTKYTASYPINRNRKVDSVVRVSRDTIAVIVLRSENNRAIQTAQCP